jgi:hypothetical protein
MAKRIEAEIDENGEVTLEVHGASGAECTEMTADIEKALGKTTDRKFKREYREQKQNRDQEARM